MSYRKGPAPEPTTQKILDYVRDELDRVGRAVADNADVVFYRTLPTMGVSLSVSAGISANWKVTGNLLLISASVTMTLTGIQRNTQPFLDAFREIVIYNVGSAAVVLKSAGSESSASNQFLLPAAWNLSANAAATLWRDPFSSKWRGLSRT